ncbi:MAG TPA: ankyrin repeat domain-containing protein, partial [Campylobacterales bacterium]|nr:ankyrin repeat domain-containing protein [Campylobacterales bacterium]
NGHKEIVQLLIDNRAKVDIQNNYGWTALMSASQNGHKEIVQLLVDNGADVNLRTNNSDTLPAELRNKTALQIAELQGHQQIVQILKEAEKKQMELRG